jgi:hypothetical protein
MVGLMNHLHQNIYLIVCELPHLVAEPSDVQRGTVRLVGCFIVFHYISMTFFIIAGQSQPPVPLGTAFS